MLDLLIKNIFVIFGGRVLQHTVGILMSTNCTPLLAELFLYSYETNFTQGLLKNKKKLIQSFHFTFRCIDGVLSLNNSKFGDFVDRIYPIKLEISDTTHIMRTGLRTKLYDERDDFTFSSVSFPFISMCLCFFCLWYRLHFPF